MAARDLHALLNKGCKHQDCICQRNLRQQCKSGFGRGGRNRKRNDSPPLLVRTFPEERSDPATHWLLAMLTPQSLQRTRFWESILALHDRTRPLPARTLSWSHVTFHTFACPYGLTLQHLVQLVYLVTLHFFSPATGQISGLGVKWTRS